jgi:hypothetical protein
VLARLPIHGLAQFTRAFRGLCKGARCQIRCGGNLCRDGGPAAAATRATAPGGWRCGRRQPDFLCVCWYAPGAPAPGCRSVWYRPRCERRRTARRVTETGFPSLTVTTARSGEIWPPREPAASGRCGLPRSVMGRVGARPVPAVPPGRGWRRCPRRTRRASAGGTSSGRSIAGRGCGSG